MSLIKSISGFRGTIGGKPNDNLTPIDIVKFASAYGSWLLHKGPGKKKVVVGRDGRISGEMVEVMVEQSLLALGIDVIHLGLSTTPTVEMAVVFEKADGGIIITASHNPPSYNGYKLKGSYGGPLIPSQVQEIEDIIKDEATIDVENMKFYQNYIMNFLYIFPSIMLNKNINYGAIPKHWKLSDIHNKDIYNIMQKYYNAINTFNARPELLLAFKLISNRCKILIELMPVFLYNKFLMSNYSS